MRIANHFSQRLRRDAARPPRIGALILWAVAAAGSCTAPAWASTLVDTPNGTPKEIYSARGAAMGSVGAAIYQGSAALVQNPAALALSDSAGLLDLTVGVSHVTEDRLIPLFDTFESFVDETAIAVNRETYADAQGGALFRLPTLPMTLGLGLFERYDFDYDYFEEFRDPSPFSPIRDTVQELRSFSVDGRLRSATAGLGAQLYRDESMSANVGLAVHRYFGTIDQEKRQSSVSPPADSVAVRYTLLSHDLSGWAFSVGVLLNIRERFDVGMAYEHSSTFAGDRGTETTTVRASGTTTELSTVPDDELEYPAVFRWGLTYHPRNTLRTRFSFEGVRAQWSQVATTYRHEQVLGQSAGRGLRDTWDVRLGLEHVFYNGMPLRLGFRYLENYAERESSRSIFSAGVGFPVAGFLLDVTGQYNRQTSRQPLDTLFDPTTTVDGDSFPAPEYDAKVEDSVVRLVFGFSRAF
jgi:hypothetical protein